MKPIVLVLLVVFSFCPRVHAQADGFEQLFNGKDLTGWSYLPTTEAQKKGRAGWQKNDPDAPPWPIVETKANFDGKAQSDDGRFVADDGTLVVTVPAEGRKVQFLYSDRVIKGDFELRLEFRASENADSGVFIRGRQLQCRDYPNAGPYKDLQAFKSGDWNELIVVVNGDAARCTCNGEVLEESFKVPEEGPIGVEGDRGKFEYRNIEIRQIGSENLLKPTNDVASWEFGLFKNGKGTISVSGDSVVFETTSTSDEGWHVQAFQVGLDLEENSFYEVSFEAKSNVDAAMVKLEAAIHEPDWRNIGCVEEVVLTKEFVKHQYKFRVRNVCDGNNRVGFTLGNQKAKVTLKNFKMRKVK